MTVNQLYALSYFSWKYLQPNALGEGALALVVGGEGGWVELEGAGYVQDVEGAATEFGSVRSEFIECFHHRDAIQLGHEIVAFLFSAFEEFGKCVGFVLAEFFPKYFEAEGVEQLGFEHIPNRQGIVLGGDELVDGFGAVLAQVEFDEGAGVEVDHQRPSRSARTVSSPVRPLADLAGTAVARWSSHLSTLRGCAGMIRTVGLPRLSTSKVWPLAT